MHSVTLPHDVLHYIMSKFVTRLLSYRRLKLHDIYLQLIALCDTKESLPYARSQIGRLYYYFHSVWHVDTSKMGFGSVSFSSHTEHLRRLIHCDWDNVLESLYLWKIHTCHPFQLGSREFISVMFRNKTVSCILGFIVKHSNAEPIFMSISSINCQGIAVGGHICPVYNKCLKK